MVPCMLPEAQPDLRFHWPMLSTSQKNPKLWRRRIYVDAHEGIPVGVMPRFLIFLGGLGVTVARWLGGCVVRLVIGRGKEGRLQVVQEGSVIELGVRVEDGGNGEEEGGQGEVLGGVGRIMRRLIASLKNLLTDFYSLCWKHKVWVRGGGRNDGEEWVEITELQREMLLGRRDWSGMRLDVLVPELGFSGRKGQNKFVFERKEVEFVEEVGKGGFGVVWKGFLKGKRKEGDEREKFGMSGSSCSCSCSCSYCLSSCSSSSSILSTSPSSSSASFCSCGFQTVVAIKELSTYSSESPTSSPLFLTTSSFLSPPTTSPLPTLISSLSTHVVADFEREVWLMSSLQHPNLVNLHGIGVGKVPFMVMELLCGGLLIFIHIYFFLSLLIFLLSPQGTFFGN